jgi:serine protease AprX
MRRDGLTEHGARSSALWGKRPGSRGSALWGKGGRGVVALFAAFVMVAGPLAPVSEGKVKAAKAKRTAMAAVAAPAPKKGKDKDYSAFVTPTLLESATANPDKMFLVIVQGDGSKKSAGLAKMIANEAAKGMEGSTDAQAAKILKDQIRDEFLTVHGVSARLSGKQILRLADTKGVLAITPDAPVEVAGYDNKQKWPHTSEVAKYWRSLDGATSVKLPAIAVVDSGVAANRADFANGATVIHQRTMTSLLPNSPGDGRGHGTFVAGIASGSARGYAGAVPTAPIVSIDVMDDFGMARTSDVIAAADWILQNKATYNIRVANFSLHSAVPNSFMYDPLAKAVERLWFSGVVVVAAAGNYGVNGQPSGVLFAPGNDPFVITVGAADIGQKAGTEDDFAAPWSAYGYTLDGFRKPDLGAPGRYIIGPVPMTSTLVAERPGNVRASGYMELSGTSMAAPVVSGMAAYILAKNPTWTPDQVKGALMVTAKVPGKATLWSLGVGQAAGKPASDVKNPPNPNAALNQFLVADPAGASVPVFDSASWARVARENASWASASWASASWASASWASASWASASWASASWASASWASASWAAASWASASWASSKFEDGASVESGVGGIFLTPEEEILFGVDDLTLP